VQTGEGSFGGVFSRCRGANGEGVAGSERFESFPDRTGDFLGDRCARECRTDPKSGIPDLLPAHVLERFSAKLHADHVGKPCLLDETLVGPYGDAKSCWNPVAQGSQSPEFVGFASDEKFVDSRGLGERDHPRLGGRH
jgi:hypothetical protein